MKYFSLRQILRAVLWTGSILLLLALLIQVALFSGVLWLKTERGNRWLETTLQTALTDSGYQVSFSRFDYNAPTRLSLTNLEVADRDGVLLKADRLRLGVSIFSLAARELALSFDAGQVDVLRFPAGQEPAVKETDTTLTIAPFTLPDLYFNRITLSGFSIAHLALPQEVAGQPLVMAPRLDADVRLSPQEIKLELDFEPRLKITVPGLPDDAAFTAEALFNPQSPALRIGKMALSSAAYETSIIGDIDFNGAQTIALQLSGHVSDLAALAPDMPGTLEISADIQGTQHAPLLNATATLSSPLLAERNLSDVTLAIKSEQVRDKPQGRFEIGTSYGALPVTLGADYTYDAPLVAFKNIAATAPDITGSGALSLDTNTMKADGAITLVAHNLQSYKDLLQADMSGKIEATLKFSHPKEQQAAQLDATIGNFKYDDVRIRQLTAQVSLADVAKPLAVQGGIAAQDLSADKAVFKTLALDMKPVSETDFSVSLKGNGRYIEPLRVNGKALLKNLTSAAPELKNLDLSIFVKNNPARIQGAVSQQNIDMTLSMNRFPLAALTGGAEEGAFAGMDLSGAVKLKGALAQPDITADISFSPLRVAASAPDIKLDLNATYARKMMQAKLVGRGKGIDTLNAQISLPLTLSLQPFVFDLPQTTPLKGSASLALETETLAKAALPPAHSLSGRLQGDARISGTLAKPAYQGAILMKDGRYENEAIGLKLRNILLNAVFQDGPSIVISELSATDESQGRLSGGGRIDLSGSSAKSDVSLKIQNAHLLNNDEMDGRLSADIRLSGEGQELSLRGTITPDRLEITIPERFNSSIPQLNIVEPKKASDSEIKAPLSIALDMKFIADNQIFVRGWGLDAEVGGTLDVTGTADAPLVNGNLSVLRGRYEEFTRRFKLTRANLRFQGKMPPSPYLDILAETDVDNITAQVNLGGSVKKPSIKFSSVPELPEDEVLSHILFGSEMRKITPFQAAQLAQTFRRLSGQGGGGFDPLATLRETTGLDDLRFETDEAGGASVGAGKYLTDKVYLEFKKGSGEQSGAATLQFELTPNIKAESEIGQDAKAGGGVYWQWDY